MQEGMRRCFRCKGRKKMFKLGSAYSHTNTGGNEVDCPLCLGEGIIETIEAFERKIQDAPKEGSIPKDEIVKAVKSVSSARKQDKEATHDKENESRRKK